MTTEECAGLIELADVIGELRSELDRARQAGSEAELRFGLGPVELEVTVALERPAGRSSFGWRR